MPETVGGTGGEGCPTPPARLAGGLPGGSPGGRALTPPSAPLARCLTLPERPHRAQSRNRAPAFAVAGRAPEPPFTPPFPLPHPTGAPSSRASLGDLHAPRSRPRGHARLARPSRTPPPRRSLTLPRSPPRRLVAHPLRTSPRVRSIAAPTFTARLRSVACIPTPPVTHGRRPLRAPPSAQRKIIRDSWQALSDIRCRLFNSVPGKRKRRRVSPQGSTICCLSRPI